jgi:hypothetical protein
MKSTVEKSSVIMTDPDWDKRWLMERHYEKEWLERSSLKRTHLG